MVNRLSTVSIKVNVLIICRIAVEQGDRKNEKETDWPRLLGMGSGRWLERRWLERLTASNSGSFLCARHLCGRFSFEALEASSLSR
jgi:hypothetical protein